MVVVVAVVLRVVLADQVAGEFCLATELEPPAVLALLTKAMLGEQAAKVVVVVLAVLLLEERGGLV